MVRWATRIAGREDEAGGPGEIELLTEIRDELRKR
jgi:hypothetical protein